MKCQRGASASSETGSKPLRRLWIGLLALVLLTPLGLLLPHWFGAGAAWGEWSTDELKSLVGYAPRHMERLANLWQAPLPDYAGPHATGLATSSAWYIFSALAGTAVIVTLTWLLGRRLARHERDTADVDH